MMNPEREVKNELQLQSLENKIQNVYDKLLPINEQLKKIDGWQITLYEIQRDIKDVIEDKNNLMARLKNHESRIQYNSEEINKVKYSLRTYIIVGNILLGFLMFIINQWGNIEKIFS